mgnify:CR=1 FL=1
MEHKMVSQGSRLSIDRRVKRVSRTVRMQAFETGIRPESMASSFRMHAFESNQLRSAYSLEQIGEARILKRNSSSFSWE